MSMRKKKEIVIITIVTYFFLAILPNLVLTNIKIIFKNIYLTITLINDNLIKEKNNKHYCFNMKVKEKYHK